MGISYPKTYFAQIAIGTFLSLASFVSIVNYTDPNTATLTTHFFFYISLFFLVMGGMTMIGLAARNILGKSLYLHSFWISFRQGLLIALCTVTSLILQAQGLLFWWVLLGLLLFLVMIELFFLS